MYVDDAIFLTPYKKKVYKVNKNLEDKNYVLTEKGSFSCYLGIQIEKLTEVSLTQSAFIERIIKSVNLKDKRMYYTPADFVPNRDL